ncbi:MAG: XRE family transcriptional regulator [Clostridiales bacterium]|nr:XRE family transcriptional regulator [Clostridiales bacterium]
MYQCSKYNNNLNVTSKKIKELRMKNNLSLSELSTKLALMGIDISKPSLHKLETGKRILKEYELYGLSKVFGVSMEYILADFISELDADSVK